MTRTSKKSGATHAVIRVATRLKNGNTLMQALNDHSVLEVNKQGQIVWSLPRRTRPEYKFYHFQEVNRLANGNTA